MPNLMAFLFGSPYEGPRGPRVMSLGLFANRLWLPNGDFVDAEKLKKLEVDNEFGNILGTQRPAFILDLSGRDLAGAQLRFANLRRVKFEGTTLRDADLTGAWLQGASLNGAQLEGASLEGTQLQDASLREAKLRRVSLDGTRLEGASLDGAQLQGASLKIAFLPGASLTGAQLQGASLEKAFLQGASLDRALLQGASLDGALLQGASLKEASLQGASLDGALLQGASLKGASLQGASLKGASLQGASLKGASVWRTHGSPRLLEPTVLMDLVHTIPEWEPSDDVRLSVLDPKRDDPADQLTEKFWEKAAKDQPVGQAFQDAMARALDEIACAESNAPYVARGIIRGGLLEAIGGKNLTKFQARFDEALRAKPEDKVSCPGARGLTDADVQCIKSGGGKFPLCDDAVIMYGTDR